MKLNETAAWGLGTRTRGFALCMIGALACASRENTAPSDTADAGTRQAPATSAPSGGLSGTAVASASPSGGTGAGRDGSRGLDAISAGGSGAGGVAARNTGGETAAAGGGRGNAGSSAATHPGVPPEVAQSLNEWPLPGKDYNNSRYTLDSTVNSGNVNELKEAWRVELPGFAIAYGKISTVPLILGGTVYMSDLSSSVWSIDLESGRVKWSVVQDSLNPGPNGVAVGWGKVFALRGSDSVVAYDAASGKELWLKRVVDTETAGIDIQPLVFDGMVLLSTVPISLNGIYTGGDRGILKALDPDTGNERWRFDTIESPANVWGNSRVNSGGGSWYPPAIDLETGRVFWAVANPAPFPGTAEFPNGSSRPGPNLYTDSTLALDLRTGSYQWHHQHIEHDIFDRDVLHTMLTEVGGVPIVVSTGKEGRVWANRRDNGAVLWGPVPVGVHMNDELTELPAGTTQVLPGSFGGVLTPPALAQGVAYVATLNAPTTYSANETSYFGSEIGSAKGNLVAIDVATGNILWDVQIDGDPTGGVTVVNDLVFTATFQGEVSAYQRETGKQVWRWTAPGGINSWMSVSGNRLIVPVGASNPAAVIALSVGPTTGGPTTPRATAGTGGGAAGTSAPSTMPNSFSAIYGEILSTRCAGPVCHGNASTGGSLSIVAGTDASTARGTLLNRAASGSECASSGLSLVVPGQPDQSLLYRKLMDMPPCGSRMPPTGALTPAELDRIRTWIANGALDD